MRGVRAKEIRKRIYGDHSQKVKEYGFLTSLIKRKIFGETDEEGKQKYENVNRTTIVCKGLRMLYQQAKADYKRIH